MKTLRIIFSVIAITLATFASAQEFFSKNEPMRLFDIGLRLGVNTSNRTFPDGVFNRWNVNSWGTGVSAGCVVDLNLRDYFSIQPGLFIESRSGNYSYSQTFYNKDQEEDDFSQLGHDRSVNLTVPILVSIKFNLSDNLRLITEAGPYAQFYLHNSANNKIHVIPPQDSPSTPTSTEFALPESFDAGLKIGAGFSFKHKFSFFIHYLAGGRKAWKEPYRGGRNKEWLFTIGYDL